VKEGSCRLGLWHVLVFWDNIVVHQIRFNRTGISGSVPPEITQYLAGKTISLDPLTSTLSSQEGVYGDIYRAVHSIPYGSVCSYGDIARKVGTSPRIVGLAMKRNTTPILIPCHRVVSSQGIGGFTPDIWIKEELIRIEAATMKKWKLPAPVCNE